MQFDDFRLTSEFRWPPLDRETILNAIKAMVNINRHHGQFVLAASPRQIDHAVTALQGCPDIEMVEVCREGDQLRITPTPGFLATIREMKVT